MLRNVEGGAGHDLGQGQASRGQDLGHRRRRRAGQCRVQGRRR